MKSNQETSFSYLSTKPLSKARVHISLYKEPNSTLKFLTQTNSEFNKVRSLKWKKFINAEKPIACTNQTEQTTDQRANSQNQMEMVH